jgi:hypothetical protein|tara:strand:+ start:343 stop:630 length:288 start_codon:yes stop_codon:yes gene_type:complete
MSRYDSDNTLLLEMLGKGPDNNIFTTEAQTGKDYYAIHFIKESVISSITVANADGDSNLQTTIPAGTIIFLRVTAITLTSGLAIGYRETDGDPTK